MKQLEIIRGAKTGKVLSVTITTYKNAYINEHGYVMGDSPSVQIIDKAEFAKYDEMSKSLRMYFDGHYRQRSYRQYELPESTETNAEQALRVKLGRMLLPR